MSTVVRPGLQNKNLLPLLPGRPIELSVRHAKKRRSGYRRDPKAASRFGARSPARAVQVGENGGHSTMQLAFLGQAQL